jgi:deazaflavin-dependent oxidoreductase (nitroreductase family)
VAADQPRAFTDTPQFKVMRAVMGAATPIIRWSLRRGSGGPLARNLLLLRFRGRRSGIWRTTPVGYARDGDVVVIVTSPSYTWWKNIGDGADVDVRLDGAWSQGRARIVGPEDAAYDETVALQVRLRGPRMLRGFGVAVDDAGVVAPADRALGGERAHIVRVELAGPAPEART